MVHYDWYNKQIGSRQRRCEAVVVTWRGRTEGKALAARHGISARVAAVASRRIKGKRALSTAADGGMAPRILARMSKPFQGMQETIPESGTAAGGGERTQVLPSRPDAPRGVYA